MLARRLLLALMLLVCSCAPVFARQKVLFWCEQGGVTVQIPGTQGSTTKFQQSFPGCTVTVYTTGTTNIISIYSDNAGTAKANPFTTSATTAQGFFYADNGRVDMKFVSSGLTTFTLSDILLNDSAQLTTTLNALAYSATPTFDASLYSLFTMTLTGNVTSSTITNSVTGQIIGFNLCQDGTGSRTLSWPASFLRPPTINASASSCTNTSFFYDGTNWRQLAATGDSLVAAGGTLTGTYAGNFTSSGNSIFTGNNTFQSIDNIKFANGSTAGADCGARINTQDTALGSAAGEIWVDQSCGTTWTTPVVLSAGHRLRFLQGGTYILSGATTNITLTGNGASINGTCGIQQGIGTADFTPTSGTILQASGQNGTTDLIALGVPAASRTSLTAAELENPEVGCLTIDMTNAGRRGLWAWSIKNGNFHDISVQNCTEDCIRLSGGLSTDNPGSTGINGTGKTAASYDNTFIRVTTQPIASNSTGTGFHIDAVNGEVSHSTFIAVRNSGNITNGGGLYGMLIEGADVGGGNCAVNAGLCWGSVNHTHVIDSYIANPTCSASSYGVKLRFGGSYANQTGGRVSGLSIQGSLIERLFTCVNGIGIGAVNSSDVAGGAGVGDISIQNTAVSSNWATQIDRSNLGSTISEIGGGTNPKSWPGIRVSGTGVGNNGQAYRDEQQLQADGNTESFFGANFVPTFHDKGFNSETFYGIYSAPTLAAGGTSGNTTTSASYAADAPNFGTNAYSFYAVTGKSRFNGNIGLSEDNANVGLAVGSSLSGANVNLIRADGTLTATGNSQSFFGLVSTPTFAKSTFTGLTSIGLYVPAPATSGSGAIATAYGGYFEQPTIGTANYALYVAAGTNAARLDGGVYNDGGGIKHKRVTGCTTGATSGNTCTTTVTWGTAFSDANYTSVCTLLGPATLGHLAAISTDVIAAASVKVETVTDTNAAIAGTINCIAIHD